MLESDFPTPQTEQIEILHDSQDHSKIFHDTHQIFNEFLEPTQQTQNTLTHDHTSNVPVKNKTDTHEINTNPIF